MLLFQEIHQTKSQIKDKSTYFKLYSKEGHFDLKFKKLKQFLKGKTNLICCSTGQIDPVFARKKKKTIILILQVAIYNSVFLCG